MRNRRKIALSLIFFVTSYFIFLILWLRVKPYYGPLLVDAGARLSAWSMGVRIENMRHDAEGGTVTFVRSFFSGDGFADVLLEVSLTTSGYSFNVPLTFALVAGLLPFFNWRKRSILEITLLLVCLHVLCIYSSCSLQILYNLSNLGKEAPSKVIQFCLEFLWTFTDKLLIRFEPFLVVVYLWLRSAESTAPRRGLCRSGAR